MQRTRGYGSTLMLQSENFSTEKRTLRKNTQELTGYIEDNAQLSSGAQQLANLKTSTEFASYNDLQTTPAKGLAAKVAERIQQEEKEDNASLSGSLMGSEGIDFANDIEGSRAATTR